MSLEGTGGGELAQLVSNHILGDIHRNKFSAVMYCDGVGYHIREDCGSIGTMFSALFLILLVHLLNSFQQLFMNERSFLTDLLIIYTPSCLAPYLPLRRFTMNLLVGFFFFLVL